MESVLWWYYRSVFVILIICNSLAGYSWNSGGTKSLSNRNTTPVFDLFDDRDFTIRRHVEAIEGQTLLLPCTVRALGDKVVSWIRSSDLHILTSGPVTFSGDNRFEAIVKPEEDFWGLQIRAVGLTDGGQYECQVNTDPKMSLAFQVTVLKEESRWVGEALIKGPTEVYVRDGFAVTFTCEIFTKADSQLGVVIPSKVRWLHDNKELFFPSNSYVSTETIYKEDPRRLLNSLQILKTSWEHSGHYTCFQMSVKPSTVKLLVVEKEYSEAMQSDFPAVSTGNLHLFQTGGWVGLFLLYFPT